MRRGLPPRPLAGTGIPPDPRHPGHFLLDRGALLAVVLTGHDGTVVGPFDERRTGLDHLTYAVPALESLRSQEERLAALGVPHSPVAETDAGHHLNVRAPD